MYPINVSHPEGYLYIVTDSHLDYQDAPYDEFISMLSQLENPQMVICLGDLFKVWLALPKFWATINKEVMSAFERLLRQGTEIVFVVGNREVLLPKQWNARWKQKFPFTHLIHDDGLLRWGNFRYGLMHGDTVNRHDIDYLRWRKIARSRAFGWFFQAMPIPMARWVAQRLEASLAETNQAFKIEFPRRRSDTFRQHRSFRSRLLFFRTFPPRSYDSQSSA